MLETAIATVDDASAVDTSEPVWIEALPARVYHTPQYGKVPIPPDKLGRMVKNFKENVRGQEICTNFDHGMDRSKGNKASGWFRDFAIRPSSDDPTQFSLYAAVELTDEAKQEIKDKKWKYFSLEWEDEWIDNSGKLHQDVVTGGGLTNVPIAKRMMPINFSEALWNELDSETQKAFAVWSTAFVNNLPDSAFLYVEPGGKKDKDGKTVPRDKRHFPYKGPDGKIDLPHLRNAIARIPQSGSWLSDALKKSLQSKARSMLSGKQMAETLGDAVNDAYDQLEAVGLLPIMPGSEHADLEHSEPGTGAPRQGELSDQDVWRGGQVEEIPPAVSDDPAIQEGWRRDPLPAEDYPDVVPPKPGGNANKEGGDEALTPEELAELRRILELGDDVDGAAVIEKTKTVFSEAKALRDAVALTDQEKKFSETYPTMWREHQNLLEKNRNNDAKAFSESVKTLTRTEGDKMIPTKTGLSSLALEKIAEVHKKFSEGTAKLEDFEEVVKTITQGGVVEYGENGSRHTNELPEFTTTTAEGIAGARKLFAEKITEVQAEMTEKSGNKVEFSEAIKEAAKRYPDLANAYRSAARA